MGTRAIITRDGQPFLATHWDGHPGSLGQDLLSAGQSEADIIRAASKHIIDFAEQSVLNVVNDARVKYLMKKHSLSEEKIRNGVRRGSIIAAEDYEIGHIENYGDGAEYQYDLSSGSGIWYVRELRGAWPESKETASGFTRLERWKDGEGREENDSP